jgi:hypothetical protein
MKEKIALRKPDGSTLGIEPEDRPGELSVMMLKDNNGKLLQLDLIKHIQAEMISRSTRDPSLSNDLPIDLR